MTVSWPAVRRYTAPAFGVSAVSIFLQPPWQGEEWRELAESKLGVIIIKKTMVLQWIMVIRIIG